MNAKLEALKKFITSDFGLPISLLVLLAVVGTIEKGFLNMLNGLTVVLLMLAITSFVVYSLMGIFSSGNEKRLLIYSFIVACVASLVLYVNDHEKFIIIATFPGMVLGLLIFFLSSR